MGQGSRSGHHITYRKWNSQWWRCSDSSVQPDPNALQGMQQGSIFLYRQPGGPASIQPKPLGNPSNNCWMNSGLQLLASISELFPTAAALFPYTIDIRGPRIFTNHNQLCVFVGAENDTSMPRHVRISGFDMTWLQESFGLRFLSAITGLGWMQDGFTYTDGAWKHPDKSLPLPLHVLQYSSDELANLHHVRINDQLFPNWLHQMWNEQADTKHLFCQTMTQLIGIPFVTYEKIPVDAQCVGYYDGLYHVVFYVEKTMYIKLGNTAPREYAAGLYLQKVDQSVPIGGCKKKTFTATQSISYGKTQLKSFEGSVDTAWKVPSNVQVYRYTCNVPAGEPVSKLALSSTEDTYYIAAQGDAPIVTYTMVQRMYQDPTLFDNQEIVFVAASVAYLPHVKPDNKETCFVAWDNMLSSDPRIEAPWTKAWLIDACKNKDRGTYYNAYFGSVKGISNVLQQLKYWSLTLAPPPSSTSVFVDLLALLSTRVKLTERTVDIRAFTSLDKKVWFQLRQHLDPDERNDEWYRIPFQNFVTRTIPFSLYAFEPQVIRDHAKNVCLELVKLNNLFERTPQYKTDHALEYNALKAMLAQLPREREGFPIDPTCKRILQRQQESSAMQGGEVLRHPIEIVTGAAPALHSVLEFLTETSVACSDADLQAYIQYLLDDSDISIGDKTKMDTNHVFGFRLDKVLKKNID
jgi:hypothetical protein